MICLELDSPKTDSLGFFLNYKIRWIIKVVKSAIVIQIQIVIRELTERLIKLVTTQNRLV